MQLRRWRNGKRAWRGVAVLALAVLMSGAGLSPSVSAEEPDGAVAPEARDALKAMSALLGGADAFSFNAYVTRDEVAAFGQKVQFSQERQVLLSRPDGLRVTGTGDVSSVEYWYDAGSFTGYDPGRGVWTSVDVPDTIEPMLDHLAFEFGMVVPIADLLVDDPYASAMLNHPVGWYLGVHDVRGTPCHHLAFRQQGVDWQIWIDAGEQPVPRKLVITFADLLAQPQWSAEFDGWEINPDVADDAFTFSPPEGVERIEPKVFAGREEADAAGTQE